jgi:hypothetical protein
MEVSTGGNERGICKRLSWGVTTGLKSKPLSSRWSTLEPPQALLVENRRLG